MLSLNKHGMNVILLDPLEP